MLIPSHNQEIVDEVFDKLQDIKFIKNRIGFHVGLDCKNETYHIINMIYINSLIFQMFQLAINKSTSICYLLTKLSTSI